MARRKSRGFADPGFAADVVAGLGRAQKRLEAKYFYHREGSRLFDRICELEEYYPTRTETRILRDNAHGLSEILSASSALVELDALPEIATYVPLDISGEYLDAAAKRIAADYPDIAVRPVEADFTRPMTLPPDIPTAMRLPGGREL